MGHSIFLPLMKMLFWVAVVSPEVPPLFLCVCVGGGVCDSFLMWEMCEVLDTVNPFKQNVH